jgi:hypothetical protein
MEAKNDCDAQLRAYYLLCSAKNGSKKHPLASLSTTQFKVLFSDSDRELFLRDHNEELIANEKIIGGNDVQANHSFSIYDAYI